MDQEFFSDILAGFGDVFLTDQDNHWEKPG